MTKDSETLLAKYPDRIPVIMKKGCRNIADLSQTKFLVPKDFTVREFVFMIRKKLTMSPQQALYMSLENGTLLNCSQLMSELYHNHKTDDTVGLTILYYAESTFGSI